MDFAVELRKLLNSEKTPVLDPMAELARAQAGALEAIYKNNSDVSMQVEEIYEIIKEADENVKEVKNAAKREHLLLAALVAMDDLLDSLLRQTQCSGNAHAEAIAAKREEVLRACGVEKTGYPGQRLDPSIHTVASAEYCDAPYESVTRVLESGFIYKGDTHRKATVIISKGSESV